jgi:PDZ domain
MWSAVQPFEAMKSGGRRSARIAAIMTIASLTACVSHTWAPGPGMSPAAFSADEAKCRIFARSAGSGFEFEASGSPRFVATATVTAALADGIAGAIEANENFNDCLQARGWIVADHAPASAASTSLQQPPSRLAAVSLVTTANGASTSAPMTSRGVPTPLAAPAVQARRPLLVRAAMVTPETAMLLRLGPPRGVVLLDVGAGGAASSAGMMAGDVILSFNGLAVRNVGDIDRELENVKGGTLVTASIWRDDTERLVSIQF